MSQDDIEDALVEDLLSPFKDSLRKGGIDDDYLLKQLKKEFRAKKRVTIKVRGAVDPKSLPRGWRVVATSGLVLYDEENEKPFSTGETILEYREHRIGVSQNARMDVHKLRGDYPAEKVQLDPSEGFSSLVKEVIREIDGLGRGKLPSQEQD